MADGGPGERAEEEEEDARIMADGGPGERAEEEEEDARMVEGWQPAGKRGACCFAHDGYVYLLKGYEREGQVASETNEFYRFSLTEGKWEVVRTAGDCNDEKLLSGACCAVLGDRVATFGGWSRGLRVADVHLLDLQSMAWRKCLVANPCELYGSALGVT